MATLKGNSSTAESGVIGVNDYAPAAPPGAGGNGGWFESSQGEGVRGLAKTPYHGGVVGVNTAGGIGVYGQSDDGIGVFGESKTKHGVRGVSHNAQSGVFGVNDWAPAAPPGAGGNGGWFESSQGEGVRGWAKTPYHGGVVGVNTAGGIGVYGQSDTSTGVYGSSQQGEGVHGETQSPNLAAVAAFMLNPDGVGAALHAENHGKGIGVFAKGGRLAGFFEGNVEVTGDITLTNAADCAEDFDIADAGLAEPGTVMVLNDEGCLHQSHQPYDKRVAGVISGAGDYKPGIVLDKQACAGNRKPVALLGKAYCKVDAQFGPIEVGDLLTTSPTPGYAMRVGDPIKAFGAVIGKALRALTEGQGLIPILIALQ